MKKILLPLFFIISLAQVTLAQTGISAAGTAPDASAMLDVIATDKGMLVPRVALVATNNSLLPIPSPADGLLVYNTGAGALTTKGFYYWDATNSLWQKVQAGNGNFVSGSGTQNYVTKWNNAGGTTIGNSQIFDNGSNVGISSATPGGKLDVFGGPITLSAGYLDINRDAYAQNGISWYAQSYPSWSTYMSPGAATSTGPHGDLTAPSGTFVTSWALRNYIENAAGYGWTFESAANTTTPAVKFEIRSSDGLFHASGNGIVDGSIGIGTTAPSGKLDVSGTTGDAMYLRSSTAESDIDFRNSGAGAWQVGTNNSGNGTSSNQFYIYDNNASAYYFTVQRGTGNVGVGLTTPTEKLEVSGAIKMQGASATDNNSPALTLVSDDDFLYDAEYINHYAMGFHQFNDGAGLGWNTYASGYYGIDLFTGGAQRFRINNNGTVKINNLAGTGTRFVVADASGNLSATSSTTAGVVTGAGTLNTIPKWTPNGSTLGNSLITDDATTITAGGQFDVTGATGTGYSTAPIEIRTTVTPRLAFHWPGVVASQIDMASDGTIRIRDNPGTGYEKFACGTITGLNGFFPANGAIRLTSNLHLNSGLGNAIIVNWDNGAVGGGTQQFRVGNGASTDQFYVRADGGTFGRVWYDLDNSGYYLDANSTSDAALRVRGGALFGGNTTWGALLYVGTDGRQNLTNSASPSVAATNGNLHMDAGSGYDMYLNYYDGGQIYFGRGDNSTRALLNTNGLYLYDGWLRTHGGNGLYFQDYGTGIRGVQADGGSYGSVSSYGALGGWNGYSTAGRLC